MTCLRRSLSEDSTDRFVHTWSVALLLFLALITMLLTAIPSGDNTLQKKESPIEVNCWAPAEFTYNYIAYVHAVCKSAFTAAINNQNAENDVGHVYQRQSYSDISDMDKEWEPQKNGNKSESAENINKLSQDVFPYMLFLFAMLLKLPHLLWQLMSRCSAINLEETLETAVQSQTSPQDSRRQKITDLVKSISEALGTSSSCAAYAFLCYKFLTLLVSFIMTLIIVVKMPDFLNDVDKTEIDYKVSDVAFCVFGIRRMDNVDQFRVQCQVAYTIASTVQDVTISNPIWVKSVVTAVLLLLIVVTVISLFSFITWFSKLVFGQCQSLNPNYRSLPKDAQLLFLLSQQNADPMTTQSLAQSEAWVEDCGVNGAKCEETVA